MHSTESGPVADGYPAGAVRGPAVRLRVCHYVEIGCESNHIAVAKRNVEVFPVMAIISTMISLDAYEKFTQPGRDLTPRWLALRGSIGKGIGHGNWNFGSRRNHPD